MARSILRAVLIAGVLTLGGSAALAQFGFIFGDPPPRPPGDVPGGRPPPQQRPLPPPQQYPPQQYPGPQDYSPPPGVQSRPLPPPPPGAAAPPPAGTPRPPVVAVPSRPKSPAELPPPPKDEEVVSGPAANKIVHPTAVFSGLDKITGRIINFPVEIGETVQFGALQLTTRACYTRPPTETANTDAFVEVDEVTLQGEVKRIFTGWMFASSPGLHAVEHPIYDVWLTDCKGGAQVVSLDTNEPQPKQQPKQEPKQEPKQKQQQPKQKQVQQQPKRPPQQQPQPLPPPESPPPPPRQQPSGFPFFR